MEKGQYTTGISIGDGSGLTGTGEVAIVVAGATSNAIPAKFSTTAIQPNLDGSDGTQGFDLGTSDLYYKKLHIRDIDATGAIVVAGAIDGKGDLTLKDGSDVQKFNVSATNGNVDAEGSLDVGGDITGGGTLQIAGAITLAASSGSPDIGSASEGFGDIYGNTFSGTAASARYADLAENYVADAEYEPGTVVVFGGDAEITVTGTKADHRVAGVVSTAPAYLMNSHQEGEYVAAVALTGRVPCKVLGPVAKGDILVAAAVPGYAVVDNDATAGRIIGKALENAQDNVKSIIEIVVGKA